MKKQIIYSIERRNVEFQSCTSIYLKINTSGRAATLKTNRVQRVKIFVCFNELKFRCQMELHDRRKRKYFWISENKITFKHVTFKINNNPTVD